MERISSKLLLNYHTEISNGIADGASDHENSKMSTTVTLRNISSALLEENIDENTDVFPDKGALQAVERSFYDTLGQKYPPSQSDLRQSNWPREYSSTIEHIQNESLPILEFKRGMEEGMKFLPSIFDTNGSKVDLQANKLRFHSERKNDSKDGDLVQRELKEGKEQNRNSMILKGKKQANSGDLSLLEGRKWKIPVLRYKNTDDEAFDKVFLLHEQHYAKEALRLRETMQSRTKSYSKTEIHHSLVDLRTLLIHCSQAIAINDIWNANYLIKQIKRHSSPNGDGAQRIAHIFVNGLEARLNGTSGELYQHELYKQLLIPQQPMTNYLDNFHILLVSNPILMAWQYFADHAILNATSKASKLHIINLATDFGFHWPCLIHALSIRIGGPLKLRITNVETPVTGFSHAERIKLVGQKLEFYSRSFGVPLEYRGIETKWDEICIDDLNIEKDEVLIVNCLHGFENLGDEADVMYSQKNKVLEIIRQIKPHVFLQGIISGSFNGSFFADRFKQVLLYTSAIFDYFDATIPRSSKQRWFLENNVWGCVVVNLIACEGLKRFIRSETYKQCHVRNSRAGFEQLPLHHAILKAIKDKVTEVYHKSFFIDDDNEWLLLGWKGRVTSAFSAWHPRQT